MRKTTVLAAAAVLAAAPLVAGVIYVPVATTQTSGNIHRTTALWVTNTDLANARGFNAYFIAAGTDGTQRPAGDPPRYWLAAGSSLEIGDLVPDGQEGLLEIDSAPELVFNAQVDSTDPQGSPLSPAAMPLLTQANLLPANATAWLLGLEKSADVLTNAGVVNLSTSTMNCTVGAREADGLLIVQSQPFTVPPVSSVYFPDGFSLIQMAQVAAGARASITCDQVYWAFSTKYDQSTGGVEVRGPGTTPDSSTLQKPSGGGGGGAPPPTPGSIVFSIPGQFASTTPGAPTYHCGLGLNGSTALTRVIVDFDFDMGSWDPHNSNGFHNIMWLNNGTSWNNMVGYIGSMGTRGQMNFQVNSGIGEEHRNYIGLDLGTPYHLHFEYDTTSTDPSGAYYEVKQNGNFVGSDGFAPAGLQVMNSAAMYIAFGTEEGIFEAATPYWTFSNLEVQLVTADGSSGSGNPVCCYGDGFGC